MICNVPKCERDEPLSRGMCRKHYMQWRRTGDPLGTARKPRVVWRDHFMYGAWAGMVNRCHNPNNSSYRRYGARGISVCGRWRYGEGGKSGFQCFLEDMGERPPAHTLDRIDPTGGYEPGNCRWATVEMQRQNISKRGDAAMRAAMSSGVKRRWAEWRKRNTLRPQLTPAQQRRLHELCAGPCSVPKDGRESKALDRLVALGFAKHAGDSYRVTAAGRDWISGGRPEQRWYENTKFPPVQ